MYSIHIELNIIFIINAVLNFTVDNLQNCFILALGYLYATLRITKKLTVEQ